jgi:hypothetical protein
MVWESFLPQQQGLLRTRCAPTPQTQKLRVTVVDSLAKPGF